MKKIFIDDIVMFVPPWYVTLLQILDFEIYAIFLRLENSGKLTT